ncbi:MAG: inorganic diphosphatase [Synergistaceae bacterium]|nr:inorganic diphosphatase [Synergistaceae bacterium]
MPLTNIPVGPNPPFAVNVFIEIAHGSKPIKYELDKSSGVLIVDRFIKTPMFYPGNYGFIPNTLSDDGDPCDVMFVGCPPVIPGVIVRGQPIGVLLMEDENGFDEKIICVPLDTMENIHDVMQLSEETRNLIQHFFMHYKDLDEGKWVKIMGWGNAADAHRLINEGIARAENK